MVRYNIGLRWHVTNHLMHDTRFVCITLVMADIAHLNRIHNLCALLHVLLMVQRVTCSCDDVCGHHTGFRIKGLPNTT